MILGAPRLNYLRYPFLDCERCRAGVDQQLKYDCFRAILENQRDNTPVNNRLNFVDFKNLNNSKYIQRDGMYLFLFVNETKDTGIKLLNIRSEYFENFPGPGLKFESMVKSLVLTKDPHNLLRLAYEGVEELKIPSFHQIFKYADLPSLETDSDLLFWPNLKSLQIHFDMPFTMTRLKVLHDLLDSFFPYDGSTKPEDLKISFSPELAKNLAVYRYWSIVTGKQLTEGSPKFKKLTLIRWNPVNSGFVRLWRRSPFLEELWLENCPSLGNVALIGENTRTDSPAFLSLPRIEKLTLVLDECPNLTDRAFKDVFRHLTLISSKPLTTITKTGINWLFEGVFATTILKFPFHTCSSAYIPAEEMPLLKAQFKTLIY